MKVFTHTSAYDAAIADYLARSKEATPPFIEISLERAQTLRYGENPNQAAAMYTTGETVGIGQMWQRQGKEGDARQLLNDVLAWFTEGFDTADLRDAQALLNELGATKEVGISGPQNE